jgi:hypothetical protein
VTRHLSMVKASALARTLVRLQGEALDHQLAKHVHSEHDAIKLACMLRLAARHDAGPHEEIARLIEARWCAN